MPLFEFYCQSCDKQFEELVFSDDKPACPFCSSTNTDKLISRPCRSRAGGGASDGTGDSGLSSASSSKSSCGGCSASSCAGCGH